MLKGPEEGCEAFPDDENLYRALAESSHDAIFLIDRGHRVRYVNVFGAAFFGASVEEIKAKHLKELFPPSAYELQSRAIKYVFESGEAFFTEENLSFAEAQLWIDTRLVPIKDKHGQIGFVMGVSRDITQRKRAEQEVELFRNLLNRSGEAIFVNDPQTGRFLDVNDKACSSLGYDREELLRIGVMDIETSIADNLSWLGHASEVKRKGSLLAEGVHRRKDGTTFPVEANVSYVSLDGGEYMIAIVRDITGRRRIEGEMRLQGEIARNISEGIYLVSAKDLRIVYANPRMEDMFGYDPGEMNGKHVSAINAPTAGDPVQMASQIENTLKETGTWRGEVFNIRKDGSTFWGHASISVLHHPVHGEVYVSIQTDITKRKQAEEKIRQSEEFVRNILDTVDEGFIVVDKEFRILSTNKAYCGQVGESSDSVIGRHCYEMSHKKLRACYEEGEECSVRHVFETGEPHAALHKHPDPKGSILYVETKAFPIKDSAGAVISVIETINNITEKHLLEEEQLKTQKLEAIGTMAGGIAHDFNNLLQGVFGYMSMAKMNIDHRQKSLDMLEAAEKALHMSVNLTAQLLTFSKGGKPVRKKIELRPIIENAVKFALSGSRIDHRIRVDEELRMVEADAGQIGQVIQNLVLNAEQAMPLGGTITITAKNFSSRQKGLSSVLNKGDYVELSIKDRGIGIPEQYLPKIFDPYFTTKAKGSGLGLATSYSIIKSHGGLIDVKSKLAEGTTFFVYLPAVDAVETSAVTVAENVQAVRKGRILVMDDEELIRNIAEEMIRLLGHEVEFAVNGEEAIDKFRESLLQERQFDVVILDLTIRGGMGGEETLRELLAIDPNIRAIVSSGYAESSALAEHKTLGFEACLTKPYDIVSLNSTLNSILSARVFLK
ncbi:MAG: PAS domain S-box protein [Thermodesulfovibrionales bacterium]|jgi:PAS domain S-box-containing protein